MFVAMLVALAAPSPATLAAPRKAYSSCISRVEKDSLKGKVEPTAYAAAVKGACAAEAAAFTDALVKYDVAMGGSRAKAAENAQTDLADYVVTSEERYRDTYKAQNAQ